jgi:hypothetical protein
VTFLFDFFAQFENAAFVRTNHTSKFKSELLKYFDDDCPILWLIFFLNCCLVIKHSIFSIFQQTYEQWLFSYKDNILNNGSLSKMMCKPYCCVDEYLRTYRDIVTPHLEKTVEEETTKSSFEKHLGTHPSPAHPISRSTNHRPKVTKKSLGRNYELIIILYFTSTKSFIDALVLQIINEFELYWIIQL